MAITTANGFFLAARTDASVTKLSSLTVVAATSISLWDVTGNPGAGTLAVGNTTTGVLFTSTTTGAPPIAPFGSGSTGYLARTIFKGSVVGGATLYDRIWGAGAFSTALGTTTFSSQPSALGRFPDGAGIGTEILIEMTVNMLASATTVTAGYTNSAGVSGRSTVATSIQSIGARAVISMALQAGDQGVQKIDSVTVGGVAGSGSFNILLARRLDDFDVRVIDAIDAHAWDATGIPVVYDSSCFWLVVRPDSTATGFPVLKILVVNG